MKPDMEYAQSKRLYRIDYRGEAYVVAESEEEEEEVIEDAFRDMNDMTELGVIVDASVITGRERVRPPKEWMNAIPFGEEEDRTVAELMEASK